MSQPILKTPIWTFKINSALHKVVKFITLMMGGKRERIWKSQFQISWELQTKGTSTR